MGIFFDKHNPKAFWNNATPEQIEERMFNDYNKKVIRNDNGCWGWSGNIKDGYGTIKKDKQSIKIHRYIWEKTYGPIPDGLIICHKCDNPPCSNIDHLFLGTHADNFKDMLSKKRQKGPIADKNYNTKLKKEDVYKIREFISSGMPLKEIAKLFGLNYCYMYSIKHRKTWAHLI